MGTSECPAALSLLTKQAAEEFYEMLVTRSINDRSITGRLLVMLHERSCDGAQRPRSATRRHRSSIVNQSVIAGFGESGLFGERVIGKSVAAEASGKRPSVVPGIALHAPDSRGSLLRDYQAPPSGLPAAFALPHPTCPSHTIGRHPTAVWRWAFAGGWNGALDWWWSNQQHRRQEPSR